MRVLCSPLGLGMQGGPPWCLPRGNKGRVDVLGFALGCPDVRRLRELVKKHEKGWLVPQSARPGRAPPSMRMHECRGCFCREYIAASQCYWPDARNNGAIRAPLRPSWDACIVLRCSYASARRGTTPHHSSPRRTARATKHA